MKHWLVKSEAGTYSWEQFCVDQKTDWTGVRNFQARNFLREMKPGDRVLYYHSGEQKAVVGTAEVTGTAFVDPTSGEGDWSAVELEPRKPLKNPVTLKAIKADAQFGEIGLIKRSRLSVMPVSREHYAAIVKLGGGL